MSVTPDDFYYKAAFLCANRDRDPDCLVKSYGKLSNVYRRSWQGLCRNCSPGRGLGHGKPFLEDQIVYDWSSTSDASDGPPLAEILYSRVTVTKGVPVEGIRVPVRFFLCGHERLMARSSVRTLISNHRVHRQRFPKYCFDCFRNPRSLLEVLQQTTTRNGDGQKNGGVEKQVDARQRRREQWLLEAVTQVATIWRRVREYEHLPREKRVGLITWTLLADKCGVGDSKTPETAAKQMSNRLIECGVKDMFPGAKSWYERFREAVVEGVESELTEEKIVVSLQALRSPSRSAA